MNGLVLKSTGSWYTVELENGEVLPCRLKGKFRQEDKRFTNPVAVGDRVTVETESHGESGVIAAIHQRHNYLVRASTRKKHHQHIIAANIDQACLILTYRYPKLKKGFIDRVLVACEAYHVPAVLVFNKIDLLNEQEMDALAEVAALYHSIGYPVLLVSAKTGQGMDKLQAQLQDKVTLMAGNSGVGKSTLINHLYPELDLRTAPLSNYSGKGQHTTTFASMHAWPFGGHVVDTPGIKELSHVDLEPEEVSQYFPEMRALLHDCKFNNCTHMDEPGCAVKAAVEAGDIPYTRYENYIHIVFDIKDKKPW